MKGSSEKSQGTVERKSGRLSGAERLTRIEARLTKIEEGLEQNRHLLETLLGKQRQESGLSQKQKGIFDAAEKIHGNDDAARREIEGLLSGLEGERATQALSNALKFLLREKEWGVQCHCGEPAAITWQKNPAYAEGGYLQFSHTSANHSTYTSLPKLQIVEKPDLRLAKNRTVRKTSS